MNSLACGSALIKRTEEELRKLAADAATAGEYAELVTLAAWARGIHDLLRDADALRNEPAHGGPVAAPPKAPNIAARKARGSEGAYPRFERQGDRLVRVAWSKSDRKEYEHRAPFAVLEATAAAIATKGANGRVFSTDEILPVLDVDGEEFPAYQPYAVIALLKHTGLLDQHGRQGYSIAQPKNFEGAVKAVWQNLPEK